MAAKKHNMAKGHAKEMAKKSGPLPADKAMTRKHLSQSIKWNKAHAEEHLDAAKERAAKLRKLPKKG